jgi:hypothetical protein
MLFLSLLKYRMFSEQLSPKGYALLFQKELIKNSVSKHFATATIEWSLLSTHYEDGNSCICSKTITYVHTIYNSFNNRTLEIGCECAKHINDDLHNKCLINQKIIKKIDLYLKKQNKPLDTVDFLDFKFSENELTTILFYKVINNFERDFISSIYKYFKKYKKLTDKQTNLYKRIMNKIIKNQKKN